MTTKQARLEFQISTKNIECNRNLERSKQNSIARMRGYFFRCICWHFQAKLLRVNENDRRLWINWHETSAQYNVRAQHDIYCMLDLLVRGGKPQKKQL